MPVQGQLDLSQLLTARDKLDIQEKVAREEYKVSRAERVASIIVETESGKVFDGDEISQGRMARAILGLQSQPEGTTVTWVLADNSVADVTIVELTEALTKAGLRQTEIWTEGA
jgi:biopolymer transport protein ExbD